MGVGVDLRHVGGPPPRAPAEERADAVGPVRRGELGAEGGGGPALVRHHGEAVVEIPVRRLVPAGPLVPGLPGGDGPHPVGGGAHGDASGDPVQRAALGVGGQDDVDGLGPPVERPVDVGDPAGPQQRQQRAEAEVPGDAGRVAQGEGGAGVRLRARRRGGSVRRRGADHHRAPGRLDHLDLLRPPLGPRHLDRLRVGRGRPPGAVRVERLDAVRGAPQPLPVQVLVVGHGVGDGPGDRAGVREVRDARDAGDGEPEDVELGAGQPDLLVDPGFLDEPVRIARDDGLSGGGTGAGDEPAVAPGGAGTVGREQPDRLRAEVPYHLLPPQLRGEAGEQDVGAEPDAERGPGLPAAGGEPGAGELGGTARPGGEPFVDALDVRPHPGGGLRVPFLQGGVTAPRGVLQAGPACEAVPGEGLAAEEGGGGAPDTVALHLQLPGAVPRGDPALGAGEREDVTGAQMRDPVGVAVEVEGHAAPRLKRLGMPK
nr:hypothetical protein [Streptomyces sp. MH191]